MQTWLIVGLLPIDVDAQRDDHMTCYRVQDPRRLLEAEAQMDPRFAPFLVEDCSIKLRARLLCVPSSKRLIEIRDRDRNPVQPLPIGGENISHLQVCYKARCVPGRAPLVNLADQFTARQMSRLQVEYVCAPALQGSRRVFVTSTRHDGNLGGVDGGDAICMARATAAGLPGSYRAWLSDVSTSPNDRFVRSIFPYVRVDGALVAYDYDDLTDGRLENPINVDEFGVTITSGTNGNDPAKDSWTGTTEHGDRDPLSRCSDWTSTDGDGRDGEPHLTNPKWSWHQDKSCAEERRLYCFEQ